MNPNKLTNAKAYRDLMNSLFFSFLVKTYHHDATAYSSAGAYRNAKNGGKS